MKDLMGAFRQNKWKYLAVICVFILQIGVVIWFGAQKADYFEDEYWTYGLANDTGDGFYHTTDRTWMSSDTIRGYLSVDSGQGFDFLQVWSNQSHDVHPPFYYVGIHILSSIFQGSYSMWIGIGLNIFYYLIGVYFFYQIAKMILKDTSVATTLLLAFGFSIGMISAMVFIRMYVMFMMIALGILLYHLKALEREKLNLKFYGGLLLWTVAGVLTQYYFLIYLFFLCGMFCFGLLCNRRIKDLIIYVVTMGIAGAASIFIFPGMISHIFHGYRGKEAISNVQGVGSFFQDIKTLGQWAGAELFGGILTQIVVLFAALLIFWIFKTGFKAVKEKGFIELIKEMFGFLLGFKSGFSYLLLWVPPICYFLVIAKISPYKTDRYIFPIYPMMFLMGISGGYFLLGKILENKILVKRIIWAFLIGITGLGFFTQHVNYLYQDRTTRQEIAEEYSSLNCVYITSGEDWRLTGDFTDLMKQDQFYTVDGTDATPISDKTVLDSKELIVYVDATLDPKATMDALFAKNPELDQYQLLYESYYSKAFYVK